MKNSLKDKLRYDYEKGTEIPSSDLWDKLEAKLDAAESTDISKPSHSFNFLKYAAVALCLVALGIIFKYGIQENTVQKNAPVISKVETTTETNIINSDSTNEVQKIEIQPVQNQEFVQVQNLKSNPQISEIKTQNIENFAGNRKQIIQNRKEESNPPVNIIDNKNIEKPILPEEKQQLIANNPNNNPVKKTNIQYVKADELLFGRELQKERKQVADNKQKLQEITNAFVQKIKPSSVTVFGVIVYSEEDQPN